MLLLPHVCRFLSLTCSTSNAAASVIEELKSFKEGLTVKLDASPGQFCYFGSRPTDHYFCSVCWFVCLFVCLFVCAEFFSAVFDPISIKFGHMLYVWV